MNEFLWDLWLILQPIVLLFVSTVGPVLVAWLAYRLTQVLKIEDEAARRDIEAKLRDALHQSAMNAAKVALARLGPDAKTAELVSEAISYVQAKNSEAVKSFGLGPNELTDIVLSKVPEAMKLVGAARGILGR
ncbi:hypothetical protein GRZ55_11520 [Chelativorans sp. ZYF759]|uniref:hypothetical protein n=1 Tax=Chelativorans sp. ZYF759 TaxID=2692213 RepID=UPI00145CE88E|nr:hypothetical protein [Chelativorans sp. ZYF759]NMG39872.1 hypothetical protein [Chelativorans sp. ZYF759]